MKTLLINILNTVTQYKSYLLALILIVGIALWGRGYSPAKAQDAPHPTAVAASQWLQDNAETYDAWKAIEDEWNRQKRIVSEIHGCTIAADRTIVDCADFPSGSRPQ